MTFNNRLRSYTEVLSENTINIFSNISTEQKKRVFFEERAPASQSLSLNANRFETTLLLPRVRTVGNDRCAVSNDDEEEDQGKTRGIYGAQTVIQKMLGTFGVSCSCLPRPLPPRLRPDHLLSYLRAVQRHEIFRQSEYSIVAYIHVEHFHQMHPFVSSRAFVIHHDRCRDTSPQIYRSFLEIWPKGINEV